MTREPLEWGQILLAHGYIWRKFRPDRHDQGLGIPPSPEERRRLCHVWRGDVVSWE